MARKIKDAKDLTTGELIYFKGHAKATYMSDGKTVEDAIRQIGTGEGESVDNIYYTDFKVTDLELLASGHLESLQIDGEGLMNAISDGETIYVPYGEDVIGGHAILLGEVSDPDIYFSVYTHQAWVYYCEVIEGVIYGFSVTAKELTAETVQQTSLDALMNIAIANALQTDGLLYALPDQATGEEDDILLSRDSVKTINGQDLFVDGNSNNIIITYQRITTNLSSVELLPNTVTEWLSPITFQDIVLTFADTHDQGYAAEYIAVFSVGADGVQLIVPDNVVWADGVLPAMTNGKTYEISFMDGYATFLEF